MKIINFVRKTIIKNLINKQVALYGQQKDFCMFELPAYVHNVEDAEKFMNLFKDCMLVYKPSFPTKDSLKKAFKVIYQKNRATRKPEEQAIIQMYKFANKGLFKDAIKEYSKSKLCISYAEWMMATINMYDFNLNKIIFVDYLLRHPEMLVAMQKIKGLETLIRYR